MARQAPRRLGALGLLGSLIGCATLAHAASPVWVIHGAHSTVYLAGSVHLLPAGDAALPPAFEQAYSASRQLVMELDLGKIDTLAAGSWLLEHGALPAGTTLRALIGEQRYARVSAAANELGAPTELFDGQAPWVVALELADLEYVHLGFDPQHGVEEQLLSRAQGDGKTTAGLETLDQELGGLAALPPADQLRLLDQTLSELQDAPQELRRGARRLAPRRRDQAGGAAVTASTARSRRSTGCWSARAISAGCRRSSGWRTARTIVWWWSARCTSWATAGCSSCCARTATW